MVNFSAATHREKHHQDENDVAFFKTVSKAYKNMKVIKEVQVALILNFRLTDCMPAEKE